MSSSTAFPVAEGRIPFREFETWYRVVGEREEPGRFPLLCLHGGPGAPHDYLETLEAIAATGRRVIFYDQLGCGNSEVECDPSMWTVDLYVEEVGVVREALGLDRVHLLGQSWGGMLAQEYALTQPDGLESLILASTSSSIPLWIREANRLRGELPQEVQQRLAELEAAGKIDTPEYQEAGLPFYMRHVCRTDPWPECLTRTFARLSQAVYGTMWGPTEFNAIGTLQTWDVTDRLHEIAVPTLITSGRYDESTPAINEVLQRGIAGSEWIIFEESAHCSHVEEPERYNQVLAAFLDRVER